MYINKYLKYKNKYLQIKSINKTLIGGTISYLWYYNHDTLKFELNNIYTAQTQITTAYNKYLSQKQNIKENNIDIKLNGEDVNITFHGVKVLKFDFDYNHFNQAIKIYKLENCMKFIEEYLYNSFKLDDIDLLSVGSGNGLFEKCCQDIFDKEIFCIDPAPLSFNPQGLTEAYKKPSFHVLDEYLSFPEKKDKSILLLIWPDLKLEYDIQSIMALNPLAFFVIYGDWPHAGSSLFRRYVPIVENNITINGQNYERLVINIGSGSITSPQIGQKSINIFMSIYINIDKINKQHITGLYETNGIIAVMDTYNYCKPFLLQKLVRDDGLHIIERNNLGELNTSSI